MRKHTETCLCNCGRIFDRPKGEKYTACLTCQTKTRLRAGGIVAGDPGGVVIAEAYAAARRRAGLELGTS